MELLSGEFRCVVRATATTSSISAGAGMNSPVSFAAVRNRGCATKITDMVGVHRPCHAREGRWVRVSRDGTLTVLTRREVGAVQIGSASYEPQAGQLNLTIKDGTNLTMKAGAGVEQWEP